MAFMFQNSRLGAAISIATGLLVAGCRSASVNTAAEPNANFNPASPQPYYRAYDRSQRNYNDSYQLSPVPPEAMPTPNYVDPPLPPSPTTQKSKRTWLPSTARSAPSFQSNSRVNQTMGSGSAGLGQAESVPAMPPSGLQTEAVPLPLSAPPFEQDLTHSGAANDGVTQRISVSDTLVADADSLQSPAITPTRSASRTRYGTVAAWPHAKRPMPAAIEPTATGSTGEMPQLLPPSP